VSARHRQARGAQRSQRGRAPLRIPTCSSDEHPARGAVASAVAEVRLDKPAGIDMMIISREFRSMLYILRLRFKLSSCQRLPAGCWMGGRRNGLTDSSAADRYSLGIGPCAPFVPLFRHSRRTLGKKAARSLQVLMIASCCTSKSSIESSCFGQPLKSSSIGGSTSTGYDTLCRVVNGLRSSGCNLSESLK